MEHEISRVGIGNTLRELTTFCSCRIMPVFTEQLQQSSISMKGLSGCSGSQPTRPQPYRERLAVAHGPRAEAPPKVELIKLEALQEEWARLELRGIQKYCMNIQERCRAVVDVGSGHTSY